MRDFLEIICLTIMSERPRRSKDGGEIVAVNYFVPIAFFYSIIAPIEFPYLPDFFVIGLLVGFNNIDVRITINRT